MNVTNFCHICFLKKNHTEYMYNKVQSRDTCNKNLNDICNCYISKVDLDQCLCQLARSILTHRSDAYINSLAISFLSVSYAVVLSSNVCSNCSNIGVSSSICFVLSIISCSYLMSSC